MKFEQKFDNFATVLTEKLERKLENFSTDLTLDFPVAKIEKKIDTFSTSLTTDLSKLVKVLGLVTNGVGNVEKKIDTVSTNLTEKLENALAMVSDNLSDMRLQLKEVRKENQELKSEILNIKANEKIHSVKRNDIFEEVVKLGRFLISFIVLVFYFYQCEG